MTDNIIDKSLFFRRRSKPTDDENEVRATALIAHCCELFEDLLTDKFTPEQRVRIATSIHDFMAYEIMIKQELE